LSFRFQADADLNPEIGRGLRRREPSIDFRAALGVIAEGTPDSEVLQIAADDDRMVSPALRVQERETRSPKLCVGTRGALRMQAHGRPDSASAWRRRARRGSYTIASSGMASESERW
jgi:hypothetical protein